MDGSGEKTITSSSLSGTMLNRIEPVENVYDVVEAIGSNVPTPGMLFESVDHMFNFYREYGFANGFSVKKRSITKDVNGIHKYLTFSCGRSDKFHSRSKIPLNHRAHSKNECKARLAARLSSDAMWEITMFDDEHNHNLSPSQSRFFRSKREITPHVKRQLEINDIAGIRPNKSHNSFVIGAGGHEELPFLERDSRNVVARARGMRLGIGDADAMQSYFLRMQSNNDSFFSLIDWDDEGRLRNVFWADPRSRASYQEFGDVITFDTTYLTNKYDMPFAPFVGVNHHGHSILLGCGLISSEDTKTFVWLFSTWLACMGGVAPQGIITDQDGAMKNAIEIVFPNTRHRWCLWHIMKKVPEKLGSHRDYSAITQLLGAAVYDSQSIDDFEETWRMLIYLHGLEGNVWLSHLYSKKEMWVPIFVKRHFWAGMSTTGRSESMNAFFDGYVNSKTTLKQFVEQYENALRKKIEKEKMADFESINKQISCATIYEMEKQLQNLYTTRKFVEFQKELIGMMYCGIKSTEKLPYHVRYYVNEDVVYGEDGRKKVMFQVLYDGLEVSCSCLGFEFRGILCRHALTVLIANDEYSLPLMYVCRRWRKDVKRCHSRVKVNYSSWSSTIEQQRYDDMVKSFHSLADLVAENDAHYVAIMKWIDEYANQLTFSTVIPLTQGTTNSNDSIPKRGKGRPPSVRKEKIWGRKRCRGSSSAAGVSSNRNEDVEIS